MYTINFLLFIHTVYQLVYEYMCTCVQLTHTVYVVVVGGVCLFIYTWCCIVHPRKRKYSFCIMRLLYWFLPLITHAHVWLWTLAQYLMLQKLFCIDFLNWQVWAVFYKSVTAITQLPTAIFYIHLFAVIKIIIKLLY